MSSLRDLVRRVASLDLTRVPQLQIHGDQAGGLEAARKKVFPDSLRVADFAHIIGARRNEGNQGSQAMKVWRSGIFKTVDSHLRQGRLSLLGRVRRLHQSMRLSRCFRRYLGLDVEVPG